MSDAWKVCPVCNQIIAGSEYVIPALAPPPPPSEEIVRGLVRALEKISYMVGDGMHHTIERIVAEALVAARAAGYGEKNDG